MPGITEYIDGATIAIYAFWFFFIGLVFWLRREDRREGYPLETDPTGHVKGLPPILRPSRKTYQLGDGWTYSTPNYSRDERPVAAVRAGPWPGAPLIPVGDPLVNGVGPAAWAERRDQPDTTWDGRPRIVPAAAGEHYTVAARDPDPRGLPVIAADGAVVGAIGDVWVDRAEHMIRYLQLGPADSAGGALLIPMNLSKVHGGRIPRGIRETPHVKVESITAAQFANVPRTKSPDVVTSLEEDRICAYYVGGQLYATPDRAEPLI